MAQRLNDRSNPMIDSDAWSTHESDLGFSDADPDFNIGRLATSRHVAAGRGAATAIRWLARDDGAAEPIDITYDMLDRRTNRFAGALRRHRIAAGSRVATVAGRTPELYVAALGALKAGCVFTPLFSAFGPESIAERLSIGEVRVLVTTPTVFRCKIAEILDRLPDLELVLVAGATEDSSADVTSIGSASKASVMSFGAFISEGHDTFDSVPTPPDTPALLHFTIGATGAPKGALHVHEAIVGHVATAHEVLDLTPNDVCWCTADPGCVAGTSYGIIAPLVIGATTVVDEAEFDAQRWFRILTSQGVDVLYTGPTAIHMLQRNGGDSAPSSFPDLRLVVSVGEPLDAESVVWAGELFGVPVLDTGWQTETDAIMIGDRRHEVVRPGESASARRHDDQAAQLTTMNKLTGHHS